MTGNLSSSAIPHAKAIMYGYIIVFSLYFTGPKIDYDINTSR